MAEATGAVADHLLLAQPRVGKPGGRLAAQVDEVERAAGPQHAPDLREGPSLRLRGQVVEDERAQHVVERALRVGQGLAVPVDEGHLARR